jgi:hypothetical protein
MVGDRLLNQPIEQWQDPFPFSTAEELAQDMRAITVTNSRQQFETVSPHPNSSLTVH